MVALACGLAALVLGIIGIIAWWWHFIDILRGALPLMLLLGGALAAYLGFEDIKEKKSAEGFDTPEEEPRLEVESLKGEVNELKSQKEELQQEVESLKEERKELKSQKEKKPK